MTKFIITSIFLLSINAVSAQQTSVEKISWPPAYEPSKSKFYVHNEIEINASPEIVWGFLIDALKWQSWYTGAKNLSFTDRADSVLNSNSVFKWRTMGLKLESAIKQFETNRVLAWESKKKSIQAYHVWLIIATGTGCKVVTDESQKGWLTFFEKTFQGKKLKKLHGVWLTQLKKQSEKSQQNEIIKQ